MTKTLLERNCTSHSSSFEKLEIFTFSKGSQHHIFKQTDAEILFFSGWTASFTISAEFGKSILEIVFLEDLGKLCTVYKFNMKSWYKSRIYI